MKKIIFLSLFIPSILFSQWVQQNVPTDLNMILSIDFANVNTGVACGWKDMFQGKAAYTTNSGINWIMAQVPDSSYSLVKVQMVYNNTGYIGGAYYSNNNKTRPDKLMQNFNMLNRSEIFGMTGSASAGYKGLFLKTTNGGRNWFTYGTLPSNVYFLYGIKFINVNTGFATASLNVSAAEKNSVLKTTNGGLSWNNLYTLDSCEIESIYTLDGTNVFVSGWKRFNGNPPDGIILKSSNGGSSWNIQVFPDCAYFYDINFPNTSTGFAVTYTADYPVYALIYKTTNTGLNWIKLNYQNDSSIYSSIDFVTGTGKGIAIGNGAVSAGFSSLLICRTTDYGSSWSKYQIHDTIHLLNGSSLVDANNWFIAGGTYNDGIIYKSANGGAIGVQPISNEVPAKFSLFQNYPNPFNPTTKIKFDIPAVGQRHAFDVRLIIYDVLGREVTALVNEQLNPGIYEVTWDASRYSSGIYFYRITTDEFTDSKRMVLNK